MKVFKRCFIGVVTVIGLFVFSVCVFAQSQDIYDELMESSSAVDLIDCLNEEQKDLLAKLGIDSVDFTSLFSTQPHKVFDLIFEVFTANYQSPIKSSITVAVMIIAVSVASQFVSSDDKTNRVIFVFGALSISLCLIVPLSVCITRVISAIGLTADFMLALLPVLACVLTASGNPAAALSYNSLCFAAAQTVTGIADGFIKPIIQIILSLSVISGINDSLNFEKTVGFIKKTTVFILGFVSTVFVTLLSLKGMLSNAADSVAVRGIRFLIGNSIPVVGGALSDAYNSVIGTLLMVKNTVAVFAVAAIAVINLPVVAECVWWVFMLYLLSALADIFSLNKISFMLTSVASAVTLLTVSLVLVVIVFILSIGLIMLLKGG